MALPQENFAPAEFAIGAAQTWASGTAGARPVYQSTLARGSPKRVNEPSVMNCRQRGGLSFLFRRAFRAYKFDLS
jgi:hypothetical protein